MSQLLRIEHVCDTCTKQFILAIKAKDLTELSCCPFCASPLEIDPTEDEEE